MDGRGRALDNVFVERLWRTVKYEGVYLKELRDGGGAGAGLARYFGFYCHERPHQALDYRTPAEVYRLGEEVALKKNQQVGKKNPGCAALQRRESLLINQHASSSRSRASPLEGGSRAGPLS